MKPVVVFDRGRPRIVGSQWRNSRAYREYRKAIDSSVAYADVLAVLEAALADPDRRLSVGLDFAPSAKYARRFVATTGVYRMKPIGSPERKMAERATRLLIYVLAAGGTRPAGRPLGRVLTAEDSDKVAASVAEWLRLVKPLWIAAGRSRGRISVAIQSADDRRRLKWTMAHHTELTRLAERRSTRPSTLAVQLAAWELGLSVHQVRRCRQKPMPIMLHA